MSITRHTVLHFVLGIGVLLLLPASAFAALSEYKPIVNIPGMNTGGLTSLPTLINSIYILAISIGAAFGVIRIAFAGVRYSMSDVITSKESAKSDIKGVLLGLAILLLPYVVLTTINPDLVKLDVLTNLSKIYTPTSTGNSSGTSSGSVVPGTTVVAGDPTKTEAENIAACNGTYNPLTKTCYLYTPIN